MHTDEFKKLADAWDKAEEYLKIAEQISDAAVVPGINELRYAGRKIIEASRASEPQVAKLLDDARMDCCRAQHDAIDASVSIVNRHTAFMIQELGYDKIVATLPDLGEFIDDITAIQEKISESRQKRLNREDVYDDIKNVDLPSVRKRYRALVAAEPSLMSGKRRSRISASASWLISFLAIIVAIIIAIFD